MDKHNQTRMEIPTSPSKWGLTWVAERIHDTYWIWGFRSGNGEACPAGTFCPTFMLVPAPAPPTLHLRSLGVLWLHRASAYDTRTSNQVHAVPRSRVSKAVNGMSWTKSSYETTWGLSRLQKQALICIMTVISCFLVVIVQVARSISSCGKLLVFKMIFFFI